MSNQTDDKFKIAESLKGKTYNLAEVEIARMKLAARCTQDLMNSLSSLEKSMNKNAESSDGLARKVLWLNYILAFLTLIGVLFTALGCF